MTSTPDAIGLTVVEEEAFLFTFRRGDAVLGNLEITPDGGHRMTVEPDDEVDVLNHARTNQCRD